MIELKENNGNAVGNILVIQRPCVNDTKRAVKHIR